MLDEIDRGLVHALHLDGRAPFARIGAVLGVSTQTVTRRYQRLRRDAGLRVVALPALDQPGSTRWLVRLTTTPTAAGDLARSLARRPDTSWVRLTSGGTEIVAVVTAPTDAPGAPSLLLHDMPRTSSVRTVNAHALLHTYLGGPTTWPGRTRALSTEQQRRLTGPVPTRGVPPDPGTCTLDDVERRLLDVLAHDGRASYGELAAATGWSPTTVARRLADLRERSAVFLDVELDDSRLGVGTRALLWLAVTPAHLDETAHVLATHSELAFVAATTGPHNLVAQALTPDASALHRYLIGPLATLDAIQTIDTAPVLRTLKSAGPWPT